MLPTHPPTQKHEPPLSPTYTGRVFCKKKKNNNNRLTDYDGARQIRKVPTRHTVPV